MTDPTGGLTAGLQIRLLSARDAVAYRSLMLQAYDQAADAFTSTAEERAREPLVWWERRIANTDGSTAAFGAFADDALIGTVALEYSAKPKTRHKALLIGMYVAGNRRRHGAGRALLDSALAHARARGGVLIVTLTVTHGNEPAVALYRRAGFEPFGVEPLAILTPDGFREKLHMACRLTPTAPHG